MGKSTVDQRGRVTLPQAERERAGLRPGDRVHVKATDDQVTIRKTVSPREFAKTFAGCIREENAVGEAVDPLRIKEIWKLAGG